VDVGTTRLGESLDAGLWPEGERIVDTFEVAGVADAVVRDDEVVHRAFGTCDRRTGEPVTPETLFHLASVSKPFVATALVSVATSPDGPALDLDAPITEWIPELSLADGRAAEVTARGLLSHTSGLPDVSDYGWHDPQLGDDALSEFARSLSGWRLQTDPGTAFSYSNAGYELLGLLLSRALGTTFEDAVRRQVLAPLGMRDSTFLRADVPAHLASSPHVGRPLVVPGDAYPYTRRHAPSSSLHSNLADLTRWITAHFDPAGPLDAALVELMSQPVADIGEPPWDEVQALGWATGTYAGQRTLSHSGADPGFGSRLTIVPGHRTGVVVLANSNTVPTGLITAAALDLALTGEPGEGVAELRALHPPVVDPIAETLTTSGADAAAATFHRLVALDPPAWNLDDDDFTDVVWGAIELHQPDLVRPFLRLWTDLRPDSPDGWAMSGWADLVDGNTDAARTALDRALTLAPDHAEAQLFLRSLRER
jgi:CubicO group peptidase (beta-lactamase class C family)